MTEKDNTMHISAYYPSQTRIVPIGRSLRKGGLIGLRGAKIRTGNQVHAKPAPPPTALCSRVSSQATSANVAKKPELYTAHCT